MIFDTLYGVTIPVPSISSQGDQCAPCSQTKSVLQGCFINELKRA